MAFFAYTLTSAKLVMKLSRYALLFIAAAVLSVCFTEAQARKSPVFESRVAAAPNPDELLAEVYQHLAANELQAAQTKVDQLIAAYPLFQLAHLIRGDLLLMHSRPVSSFGGGAGASADKLKDMRDEATARIKAYRERPAADLVPSPVLQLRDDQKQVLVIDAVKARLYLYENSGGQLKLLSDHYISHGKFGLNKIKEGDQRTPVGVYYITSRLSGSKLPDFYGPGALPLNYPNEWDKINGRSGSGIWLHGMPSTSFSRPPFASDGCVVLTNLDFLKISELIDIGKTPVIISEHLEFITRAQWSADKQLASNLLEEWRRDMESRNANRIFANYSRNFKTLQAEDLNTWFARQRQIWELGSTPLIQLKEVTQFRYPGKDEIIVSTFTQETQAGKSHSSIRKRQYWLKEAGKWRIIYEAAL